MFRLLPYFSVSLICGLAYLHPRAEGDSLAVDKEEQALLERAKEKLAEENLGEVSDLTVTVLDEGVITLNGEVPTVAAKKRMRAAAEALPEVKEVHDDLVVRLGLQSDVVLRQSLHQRLIQEGVPEAENMEISVDDGFVTLRGMVSRPSARVAAVALLEEMPGVRGVYDEMDVSPDEVERPDEEKEVHIRRRWDAEPGLSEAQLSVSVVQQRAVIRGSVVTLAQARLAEDLARVPGILAVDGSALQLGVERISPEHGLAIGEPSDVDETTCRMGAAVRAVAGLPEDAVEVAVMPGMVVLRGRVAAYRQKTEVRREVSQVTGENQVVDLITVAAEERRRSDQSLLEEIDALLQEDVSTQPYRFQVAVTEANVSLEGWVPTEGERLRAEQVVARVCGIEAIENRIRLATQPNELPSQAGGDPLPKASEARLTPTSDPQAYFPERAEERWAEESLFLGRSPSWKIHGGVEMKGGAGTAASTLTVAFHLVSQPRTLEGTPDSSQSGQLADSR